MPEGVDAQPPVPLTPDQQSRLDEIQQLDSQVFGAKPKPKTFYEQHDTETKLDDLIAQLSQKTGLPRKLIVRTVKVERELQRLVDDADIALNPNQVGISSSLIDEANYLRPEASKGLEKLRDARSRIYEEILTGVKPSRPLEDQLKEARARVEELVGEAAVKAGKTKDQLLREVHPPQPISPIKPIPVRFHISETGGAKRAIETVKQELQEQGK